MQETVLISLPMDELKKLISEAVSCGSVSKLGVNESGRKKTLAEIDAETDVYLMNQKKKGGTNL
jgi:hypothetical protein